MWAILIAVILVIIIIIVGELPEFTQAHAISLMAAVFCPCMYLLGGGGGVVLNSINQV